MGRDMKVLAIALSVVSLSAFAGRDGSDILLQQQQARRLQDERAKANAPVPDRQQIMEDCRKMAPKQS